LSRALDLLDLQLATVRSEYERLSSASEQRAEEVRELIASMDALFDAWTALIGEFLANPELVVEMPQERERRAVGALLRRLAVLRSKALALELAANGAPGRGRNGA
jgi:hypothetical protein